MVLVLEFESGGFGGLCKPGARPGQARPVLAQFEFEGGDLHGVQVDGGVVGQRGAGVHQSQSHGLEQLEVKVPKQLRHRQLVEKGRGREGDKRERKEIRHKGASKKDIKRGKRRDREQLISSQCTL